MHAGSRSPSGRDRGALLAWATLPGASRQSLSRSPRVVLSLPLIAHAAGVSLGFISLSAISGVSVALGGMAGLDWDLLSSYAGLLSLATFSIYTGSYGSLQVSDSGSIHIMIHTDKVTANKTETQG